MRMREQARQRRTVSATIPDHLARAVPAAHPVLTIYIAEMRLPRDAAFKRFVHNAAFVRDLLRAYPLEGLDAERIERIELAQTNLIGPDLSQRLADSAWRLTMQDGEFVYLLLECQSEPDATMPLRMLHAVATLDLALSRDPPAGYTATRLPGVLHLTVYSGRQRWTGAGEVAELIAAGSGHVPRMASPVLELRRWREAGWDENLAVLVARLQRCADPEACTRPRLLCGSGRSGRGMRNWRARSQLGSRTCCCRRWGCRTGC